MEARDADSIRIKPLTKKTQQGVLYTRRAEAERQIEKVLMLGTGQALQMLESKKRRDEEGYLLDETIVYLVREARAAGDEDLLNRLYVELNRRIWRHLAKFRGRFSAGTADFEDFGQKTEMAILRKILDTESDAADFAQAQFGSFVVSEAKTAWKNALTAIIREQKYIETLDDGDASDGDGGRGRNALENLSDAGLPTAEDRLIYREGFRQLSPDHQLVAAMLLDGFQIESKDENEMTISRHLGVTSRTIRNWVREMRAALTDNSKGAIR